MANKPIKTQTQRLPPRRVRKAAFLSILRPPPPSQPAQPDSSQPRRKNKAPPVSRQGLVFKKQLSLSNEVPDFTHPCRLVPRLREEDKDTF